METLEREDPGRRQAILDWLGVAFAGGVETVKLLFPPAGIPIEVGLKLHELWQKRQSSPNAKTQPLARPAQLQAMQTTKTGSLDTQPYVSDEEQAEIEAELGFPSDYEGDELVDMTHWVQYGGQISQAGD